LESKDGLLIIGRQPVYGNIFHLFKKTGIELIIILHLFHCPNIEPRMVELLRCINSKSLTGAKYTIAIIILGTAVFVCADSSAQMLRPARAVYDLRLNNERESGNFYSAAGRLVVELIEDCSGFIFNHSFISKISAAGRSALVHNTEASIWESRDGQKMRFNMTQKVNGTVVEREQGRADLTKNGDGKAVWELPQSRTLKLPIGTLFPVSYNRLVTQSALYGKDGFEIPLFDGNNQAGFYHAAVFIGTRQSKIHPNKGHQSEPRSWSVRLAYYNYDSLIGLPEFEIGFLLFSDGVVDNLKLDYQEFGLIGDLKELAYLEQPNCE